MVWWLSDTRFVAIVVTCRRLIAARRLARATDSLEDAGGGNIVEHGLVGGRQVARTINEGIRNHVNGGRKDNEEMDRWRRAAIEGMECNAMQQKERWWC